MRMVDLRSSGTTTAPSLEVRSSAGTEVLRLIGVLLNSRPQDFDVGAERIQAVRERVPTDLLDEARRLSTGLDPRDAANPGDDMAYITLTMLGGLLPAPAGVEELLALLDAQPAVAWRLLVARQLDDLLDDARELRARLVSGDDDAAAEVTGLPLDGCSPEALQLITSDPATYGAAVRRVVDGFATTVWPALADEAMGPIEREVAHRQQLLAAGADPAAVVLDATNGYELAEEPAGRTVVLLPSYWLRPWLVVGDIDGLDIEVISTVVADEFLALPSEAPPPALLKLFKALSDEGRLKLLRRMTTGPLSLIEATDELGVTKATAHHHLSILRQAGLVTMGGEGRATRYTLRDDPSTVTHEALASYVPTRR